MAEKESGFEKVMRYWLVLSTFSHSRKRRKKRATSDDDDDLVLVVKEWGMFIKKGTRKGRDTRGFFSTKQSFFQAKEEREKGFSFSPCFKKKTDVRLRERPSLQRGVLVLFSLLLLMLLSIIYNPKRSFVVVVVCRFSSLRVFSKKGRKVLSSKKTSLSL